MKQLCNSCGQDMEMSIFCDEYDPTPCPGSVSGAHDFSEHDRRGFKGQHDDSPSPKHPKPDNF